MTTLLSCLRALLIVLPLWLAGGYQSVPSATKLLSFGSAACSRTFIEDLNAVNIHLVQVDRKFVSDAASDAASDADTLSIAKLIFVRYASFAKPSEQQSPA